MKVLLAMCIMTFCFSLQAEMVKVHVPEIVCEMCAQKIQKSFENVVKNAETDVIVNVETKIVTISTINPISDKEIKKRIENLDYTAKSIKRVSEKAKQ